MATTRRRTQRSLAAPRRRRRRLPPSIVVVAVVVSSFFASRRRRLSCFPPPPPSSSAFSALPLVDAFERCGGGRDAAIRGEGEDGEDDYYYCPTGNTCCPGPSLSSPPSPSSYYCIPNDLGSYNATCCAADDGGGGSSQPTGCGAGYACDALGTCSATRKRPIPDDPFVRTLPRYRLCRASRGPPKLYGFPVAVVDGGGGGGEAKLAYYSSHGNLLKLPLPSKKDGEGNGTVRMLLVVVHGANRNADDYFCTATAAVERYRQRRQGEASPARSSNDDGDDDVLVVAPRFVGAGDRDVASLDNGGTAMRWNDTADGAGPWRYGDQAAVPRHDETSAESAARYSSFRALDLLVSHVSRALRSRGLRRIVVVGHSSGGQLVHRWSLLTPAWNDPTVEFRGVVANPSSYAYLTPYRFLDGRWGIPNPTAAINCPKYDRWEWGLESEDGNGTYPVQYATDAIADVGGVPNLIERFRNRTVVYLAGSQDRCNVSSEAGAGSGNWCDSHGLETTCMDELQGGNRWERHERYVQSLRKFPRSSFIVRSVVVPGVGHDHSLVFNSDEGLEAIFGELPAGRDGAATVS